MRRPRRNGTAEAPGQHAGGLCRPGCQAYSPFVSVSTARSTVEVECPGCGHYRWVSPERATRIDRGVVSPLCRGCKNLTPDAMLDAAARADFTDEHVRWWANTFGAEIPENVRPQPWIRAHGLPDELHAIVASIRPR